MLNFKTSILALLAITQFGCMPFNKEIKAEKEILASDKLCKLDEITIETLRAPHIEEPDKEELQHIGGIILNNINDRKKNTVCAKDSKKREYVLVSTVGSYDPGNRLVRALIPQSMNIVVHFDLYSKHKSESNLLSKFAIYKSFDPNHLSLGAGLYAPFIGIDTLTYDVADSVADIIVVADTID